MRSQTRTKHAKARSNKKTAESAENISAMKQNQNIYNDVSAISSPVVLRKSLQLSTHRASNILGKIGYLSKNNLEGLPWLEGKYGGFTLLH